MAAKKRSAGKIVLNPELRPSLVSLLTHAELNGAIISEYRMAVYSGLEKHRPDLNSTTVNLLTLLLKEPCTNTANYILFDNWRKPEGYYPLYLRRAGNTEQILNMSGSVTQFFVCSTAIHIWHTLDLSTQWEIILEPRAWWNEVGNY